MGLGLWVEEKMAVLARSSLFSDVSPMLLRQLAEISVPEDMASGHVLVEAGSVHIRVGVVASGKISLSATIQGMEIVYNVLNAGDACGLPSLTAHKGCWSRIRAALPSRVLWIDSSALSSLIVKFPAEGVVIMSRVADGLVTRHEILVRLLQQNLAREYGGLQGPG